MRNDRISDLEAVSIEVVQILQDHHALTSRLTHVIEKLALMMREDRQVRDALDIMKAGALTVNEAREINTAAEMPARTDMAGSVPEQGPSASPESEPKPAPKGDHGRTDLPEPEDAPSVRAMTLSEHTAMHEKPAGAPLAAKKSKRDAILDLYAETGGTYQEIATALGTTPGGVAAQIAICRARGDSRVADGDRKAAERRAEVPAPESKSPPPKPEPEPAAPTTKKERALNHYAATGADLKDIATGIETTNAAATVYFNDARYAGDPRVAKGDLIRLDKGLDPVCPAKQEDQPAVAEGPDSLRAYRANTQPKTHEPHRDDVGKVAICTLDHTTGMLDGPDDEVIIRDLKHRAVIEVMIRQNAKSESTIKSLFGKGFNGSAWDEIQRMNLALAKAGLVIHSIDGGPVYQLRKLV